MSRSELTTILMNNNYQNYNIIKRMMKQKYFQSTIKLRNSRTLSKIITVPYLYKSKYT